MGIIAKNNILLFWVCICLIIFPCVSSAQNDDSIYSYGYDDNTDNSSSGYDGDSYSGYDNGDSESTYSDDNDNEISYSGDNEGYGYSDDSDKTDQYVQEPAKPLIKPKPPINLKEKTIRIGRIPYMSIKKMMTHVVPFLRLLQKKTGAKEVRLVSSCDGYSGVIHALAREKIDFAWVSPIAYLENREKDHLMPVAKAKFGNDTSYKGVFIAPINGKVQGLEDLKDSKIGFVDPESASGYIYPMYLLKFLKINLGRNHKILFLKNHDNVLKSVLSGKVDAGCCLEETLKSYKDKNLYKKIIVLAKTPEIPSDVIVCRQDCPINLREIFEKALTGIKQNELPKGSPTFLPAYDEEFVQVEQIMKFTNAK